MTFVSKTLSFIGRNWPLKYGTGFLVERPASLVRKWPEDNQFTMKDGRIFRGDLNDRYLRSLYLYGEYEPLLDRFLRQAVKSGDVAIDVGANIGVISILLGILVGPTGCVYSFEPVPELNTILRENIIRNGLSNTVLTISELVGDHEDAETNIYVPYDQSHANSSMIIGNQRVKETYKCKLTTLSNCQLIERKPNIIKVDVEGAELAVLKGSKTLLESPKPPIWIVEINHETAQRFGYNPNQLVEVFLFFDYKKFLFSNDNEISHYRNRDFPSDGLLYAIPEWAVNDRQIYPFTRS